MKAEVAVVTSNKRDFDTESNARSRGVDRNTLQDSMHHEVCILNLYAPNNSLKIRKANRNGTIRKSIANLYFFNY